MFIITPSAEPGMVVNVFSIHENDKYLYSFVNAVALFKMEWISDQENCSLLFYLAKLFSCQLAIHFSHRF